jgi:hypothetical protein
LYQGWAQFFGTPDLQPAMARVTQAGSKAVRKRVSGQIILLCYWYNYFGVAEFEYESHKFNL